MLQSRIARLVLGGLLATSLCKAHAQTSAAARQVDPLPSSSHTAQESKTGGRYDLQPGEDPQNHLISPFLKHLASDQKQFWTFPTRLQVKDLKWIAPSAGMIGAFIASDSWWSKQVPASHVGTSKTFSDYGTYSLIGLGGASFLFGQMTHNDHMSETGLLAGEAGIDSAAVAYLFKGLTQRQRPYQDHGNGKFFAGGSSFPSEHSAIAWSIASIFAHEYPGWLTQATAYGLASAITVTRVTAQQHFPSDVIVGSLLGWYFGRQVYRAHHDPEEGGSAWGNALDESTSNAEHPRNPENMGSPYVPPDSWVYPAIDRLIALGYVHSDMAGMRPWTRMQFARLLDDAETQLQSDDREMSSSEQKLFSSLSAYFHPELERMDGAANVGLKLDSIYTRSTGISGQPLRDGFHLGQTIINDYGRPYAEGFNNVTGFSGDAEAGPFYVSLQAEYQHAPATPSYPDRTLLVEESADEVPLLSNSAPTLDRFRLMDSAAGFTYKNFQISVGKQSLWLGPGYGGPFLFSNNAEPIPMVRFDQVAPVYVPGLSRILGPMRAEFALGKTDGAHWINSDGTFYGPAINNQPFIHIDKVSFQPTKNFEFGMGISAVFGGPGSPVTWGNFFLTYSPHCSIGTCQTVLFNKDYGDRSSAADFSYRLPHLRDWATLYVDSLVTDEISPIGSSRPAIRAGLYLPKLPKLSKVDVRAESVYTDAPNTVFIGNYYDNGRYRSGYTNYGQIMGSWIGRAGKGGQAWATYWFSPRSTLQLQYRRQVVSKDFISGGGGLNDFGMKVTLQTSSALSVQGLLQYESWNFPVLAPLPKNNVTASVQLTIDPKWSINKRQ
jgi:Capsule assembly protein Wzi/PAP2 superfamily